MTNAVIVSTARTPLAKSWKGAFNMTHGATLGGHAIKHAIARAGIDAAEIEDVIMGCANPEGATGWNIARQIALRAGMPVSVAGMTVNRFCSSGLQTVAMGAQAIMSGMNDVVLAGGVEMMSQVPMSGYHVRLHPEMTEEMIGMGFTAERVAQRWGITREQQDAFAADSHKKAAAAIQRGAFKGQVTPVAVSRTSWNGPAKTEMSATFDTDELVRPDTTAEGLGKLKPAFSAKGTVTAGNASPYSDGAAAVLMMSADRAKALGVKPLARFVSFATAGVAPDVMGVGPVKAVPKALAKAGVALDAVKLIEFNEAFAAQALAVVKDLGMDLARTNVNGGAIALGHPLGATGAKLTAQLVHELGARGGGLGMVTMCIGGGMGAAGLFEVMAA